MTQKVFNICLFFVLVKGCNKYCSTILVPPTVLHVCRTPKPPAPLPDPPVDAQVLVFLDNVHLSPPDADWLRVGQLLPEINHQLVFAMLSCR